ncbi:Crp/Fnr family transcriptional regulator [Photobacterium sp. BZF1]|uniref:Crp/Fnr family transcriptional regulator n=1 Tax=Photobacterium sp. BZF1 TaxID=1904457 RepID=UPI001653B53D|nr:Crp/Fnr family transcriptional regulator [Photobacterium sp. BZF1]MBC7005206.1 Crp/Fnr family transcriptional regulator [Photobacterium sp. BZF1]
MRQALQQIYGLSDDLTALLIQAGTFRTLQRGKYLGFQNEYPEALYLPIDGIIALQAPFESKDDYFYAVFSAGILVNDMYLLNPQPRLESLKALTDVTVLSIPISRARELINTSLAFSRFVLKSISLKLYTVTSINYIHSEKNPEQKILMCLQHLANLNPDNRVYLNFRHIASLMVISRNTVAKVVKDLQKKGVLRVEKNCISFSAEHEHSLVASSSLH